MKVLILNGSYRGAKGYTAYLAGRLADGVRSAGGEAETIHVAECSLRRCTGCFSCQREDRIGHCVWENHDDAARIFEAMRAADVLVFASPIYVFHQSSLLHQLFDRFLGTCDSRAFHFTRSGLFFHQVDRALCAKPFVTAFCQDNLETWTHRSAMNYYRSYHRFMDAPWVGKLVRPSGGRAGHGRADAVVDNASVVNRIHQAWQEAGAALVKKGRIPRSFERRANRPLVRIPWLVRCLLRVPAFRERASRRIQDIMAQ